jgi:2-oxoglutarate ferredoxin oxidoreductase subunit delta
MLDAKQNNETAGLIKTECIKFGDSPEKVMCWVKGHLEECQQKLVIAKGWCKRCDTCITFCPVKALDHDEEKYPKVDNHKCISCGTCEILCPDFAIFVTGLKDKKTSK